MSCRIRDRVAWLSLDCGRGGRLDARGAQALCEQARGLRLDEAVHVVVVQSPGADFCLGFEEFEPGPATDCVSALADLRQPVLAVISGRAVAEGCELALACDMRLASTRAVFALPQVDQGRLPRFGATQRLPRLVGGARALEILWSGRPLRAAEAVRIGMVTRTASPPRLRAAMTEMVRALRRKGPIALRLAKEAVCAAADLTLEQGMRMEEDLYALLQTTEDRAEGIRSFRRRRAPRFRGK